MDIEHRIWHELMDSKKQDQYLCYYLAKVKQRKRWYKVGLIVISVLGIALTQVSSVYPTAILVLIVIVEILKNMIPEFFPDEQLIEKLPEYRMMYVMKFEKLDELWVKYKAKKFTEDEAINEYFLIRKDNAQIEAMDNAIWLPEKNKLMKKSDSDLATYVENHYTGISELTESNEQEG